MPDINYIDRLNLREFIIQHKLFVNENTKILEFMPLYIGELYDITDKMDYVIYRGIIMTDNTALYEVDLIFSIPSDDLLDPLEFHPELCAIVNIYNNYGSAVPYP